MDANKLVTELRKNFNLLKIKDSNVFEWEDYGSWDIAQALKDYIDKTYPHLKYSILVPDDNDNNDGDDYNYYQFFCLFYDNKQIIFSLQDMLLEEIMFYDSFYLKRIDTTTYTMCNEIVCYNEYWGDPDKIKNELPLVIELLFEGINLN